MKRRFRLLSLGLAMAFPISIVAVPTYAADEPMVVNTQDGSGNAAKSPAPTKPAVRMRLRIAPETASMFGSGPVVPATESDVEACLFVAADEPDDSPDRSLVGSESTSARKLRSGTLPSKQKKVAESARKKISERNTSTDDNSTSPSDKPVAIVEHKGENREEQGEVSSEPRRINSQLASTPLPLKRPDQDADNTDSTSENGTKEGLELLELSLSDSARRTASEDSPKLELKLSDSSATETPEDDGLGDDGLLLSESSRQTVTQKLDSNTNALLLGNEHGQEESESNRECPGAPDGSESQTADLQPDDIPLEQEQHPYDAPAATSSREPDAMQLAPIERFTSRELAMQQEINRCLDYFLENPETVVRRGPWALMHATLPFGVETEVVAGRQRVNAIGWMCYNGVCARQRMFQPTRTGFRTNVGPGVQGHEGQFLAILAQSRVNANYPIKIGNRSYTIQDLVRYEMETCREKSELTFKLIGLSYYLDQDTRWRDNRGHTWNLEKMVAEELAQPINGVACGGSHRLMGLSYAIIERQRDGYPITGHWKRAEDYLNDYINYTMTLQNPDGSFSTEWFEARGNDADVERKVQTTGHMLEWLIYTLPDEHLRSPQIQKSVEFLLQTVGRNPGYNWPIGPRGHALRSLTLYNQRVFGAEPGRTKAYVADQRVNVLQR